MNAITATRRTIRREWTAFGALLIVSVGLMGMSGTRTAHDLQSAVNSAVKPAEEFLNGVTDTAGSYWSALTQIDRLRTRNAQLEQQNQTLQEQLSRMGAISKINDDWSKITAAAAGVPYQTTPVRVIVRDISNVSQLTIVINKGSDDGLVPGEVVIDAGGAVVGRIDQVAATVSSVLLISDPTSVVVGKGVKSDATGTIHGSISGQLQMQYIDTAEAAKMVGGETVVTAGESLPCAPDKLTCAMATSAYPPGLLIGTVTTVQKDPNAVVQNAIIAPSAHLNDATFLLVIIDYKGGFGPIVTNPCAGASAAPGATAAPGASPGSSLAPSATCAPVGSPSLSLPSLRPVPTPTPTPRY